jgi:hypothetical protein
MTELVIQDSTFRVYESGDIERKMKSGTWKQIKNTANHNQGYNVILVQKKQYMRSRLMFLAYLNVPMNEKIVMHHKDGNRLNCALNNLTIETYSSMSYYRTDTNGWHYDSKTQKYIASITKNGTLIQLGKYDTPDEAYEAYIKEREVIYQR